MLWTLLTTAMLLVGGVCLVAAPQRFLRSVTADYEITFDVTYLRVGSWEAKLDVYKRTDPGPHPTLLYFHGGGAISTVPRRQYVAFDVMPYLESGWNVVNIEYDVPGRTVAPIAVQNGICALRWVVANAKEHGFDVDRIVTSGYSSGGWMALMTAMTAGTPAWDGPCAASATARVAGVVSWSAPSDLPDLLEGPNAKGWTAQWFTTLPERLAIAKAVSPITLVRSGLPPVLSIHGDTDGTVPYAQSVRLHEALRRAKVPEKLLTVSGGHGFYPRAEQERIFGEITTFLLTHGLSPKR